MTKLKKYEKETILLSSEGDDYWEIYTFNPALKRRFAAYAKKHPDLCELKAATKEGSVTYRISKARLSIRLTEPYSEERRRASSERAKRSDETGKIEQLKKVEFSSIKYIRLQHADIEGAKKTVPDQRGARKSPAMDDHGTT